MVFLKVGGLSFGGGPVGWVHREVVTLRAWLTEEQFMADLAFSQIFPGTNISNLAVCIGQRLRGFIGAATALTALLLVPFFAVIGLAMAYGSIRDRPWVQSALDGVAAAAIGLILLIAVKGARSASRSMRASVAFAATFLCVGILQWPMVPVVIVVGTLSVIAAWPRKTGDA